MTYAQLMARANDAMRHAARLDTEGGSGPLLAKVRRRDALHLRAAARELVRTDEARRPS